MSDINWDDIMAVTLDTINPIIQQEFEKASRRYDAAREARAFNSRGFRMPFQPDLHSWKSNLRDMARMLEGEIKLPHEVWQTPNIQWDKDDNSSKIQESEGTYIPMSTCEDCYKAFKLRAKYLLSKENVQQLS